MKNMKGDVLGIGLGQLLFLILAILIGGAILLFIMGLGAKFGV